MVKLSRERMQACLGELAEAPVQLEAVESFAGAGELVVLPALLDEGLIVVTEGIYDRLKDGLYGLCRVLLTLAFMSL